MVSKISSFFLRLYFVIAGDNLYISTMYYSLLYYIMALFLKKKFAGAPSAAGPGYGRPSLALSTLLEKGAASCDGQRPKPPPSSGWCLVVAGMRWSARRGSEPGHRQAAASLQVPID
jgi:hypothetical protein